MLQPSVTPAVEMTLEQQILAELQGLRDDVAGARGQFRDLRVMLMGSGEEDVETQHGRLSIMDRRLDKHETRIEANETGIAELKSARSSNDASTKAFWTMGRLIWAFVSAFAISSAGGVVSAFVGYLLRR